MSESGVQNGFIVASSVSDGMGRNTLSERGRYTGTFRSRTVQNMRGGCPKWFYCSAVRIGRHGSEYPLRERALHRNIPFKDTPESRSRDVQNGFIVAPSVSDGKIGTPFSISIRFSVGIPLSNKIDPENNVMKFA